MTRATMTLIGVFAAGVLLWLASKIIDPGRSDPPSTADYWGWLAVCASAGLALSLSQLLGGWTKWGWPRLSLPVFLIGFLPALLLGGWIVAAFDPSESWLQEHIRDWSGDLDVDGFVDDVGGSILHVAAIALAVGAVFGFCFDTTGRVRRAVAETAVEEEVPGYIGPIPAADAAEPPVAGGGAASLPEEERTVAVDDPETGGDAEATIVERHGGDEPTIVERDTSGDAETVVVRDDAEVEPGQNDERTTPDDERTAP